MGRLSRKSVNMYFSKYHRIAEAIEILESVKVYDHMQNPLK